MKRLIFAAALCSFATTPAYAETNFFKLYRNGEGPSRVSIETRQPIATVKQCVLSKTYILGEGNFLPSGKQQIKPIQSQQGNGETYWWGERESSSIDFTTLNGITKVSFYGHFPIYTKLPEKNRQLPTQFFSYFSECFNDAASQTDTTAKIVNPIYSLDSTATPTLMADCVSYNVDRSNRTPGAPTYLDPHITRSADGFYAVDYFNSYKNTGQKLFIASKGSGSRIGWTRSAQRAFVIIKLDDPAGDFNKEWAEKNHPVLSAIKNCSNIAEGKAPAITTFPLAASQLKAAEVFDSIFAEQEKRYAEGKIEMAEMPLEVLQSYQPPAGETIKNVAKNQGPVVPVKFIAAAAIANSATSSSQKGKKGVSASNETILPLIYMHPRTGSRQKDKATILQDTANHLYCNENDGFAVKGLASIKCYQDKDQDGQFETSRMANVKFANSASHIYFATEASVISPIAYRKLGAAEIPQTTIYYRMYVDSGVLKSCPYYQGVNRQELGYSCYRSFTPEIFQIGSNAMKYVDGALSASVTIPLNNNAVLQSFTTFPAGTLLGKQDRREPISKFGTEPLWIDSFLKGKDYVKLRDTQFGAPKLQGSFAKSGVVGQVIATTFREPHLSMQLSDVVHVGSGNSAAMEKGQSLAGFSFSLDTMLFEPARLFACGMTRLAQSSVAPQTFCFVADRDHAGTLYRFNGNLNYIPNTYTSVETGPLLRAIPSNASAEKMWTTRTFFTGWETNEVGQEFAKFTTDIYYENRLINSQPSKSVVENGTAKREIAGIAIQIRKSPNGGYELSEDGAAKP